MSSSRERVKLTSSAVPPKSRSVVKGATWLNRGETSAELYCLRSTCIALTSELTRCQNSLAELADILQALSLIGEFNTLEETAKILRVSASEFRKLRRLGVIPPPVVYGNHKRYTRDQLLQLKRQLHVKAGANL